MKKVTIYTGDPCSYCEAAKALLKTKNIEIENLIFGKIHLKLKRCYKEQMVQERSHKFLLVIVILVEMISFKKPIEMVS